MKKPILLTGDRPTGDLHIGHYVGSLKTRVEKQDSYQCFILIADLHMLATKSDKESLKNLHTQILCLTATYLACGINPSKTSICLQSSVGAIYRINTILGMLTPFNKVFSMPSIKEMARNSHVADVTLGLYNYPVLQSADILSFNASFVPVGKDNEKHIELTRYLAKKFNRMYGKIFTIPKGHISATKTLIGTNGKTKMSKSLNNAISLTDTDEVVKEKVMKMFTDPNRVSATTPGNVSNNPVFHYLYEFDNERNIVDKLAAQYKSGTIKDVEVKERLVKILTEFISPIRKKIENHMKNKEYLEKILADGTKKARAVTEITAEKMLKTMNMNLLNF